MRLSSATAFDNTINNLTASQVSLSEQQDRIASGKRVSRASDDPIGAASAERALTRIARLQSEQRAVNLQRNSLATAESTLGDAGNLVQRFRELVVNAGNASNNASDRSAMAQEMESIRDQLLSLANTRDSNGVYLFSGLESAKSQTITTPAFSISGAAPNQVYQFNGTPGQNLPTQTGVPFTLDGDSTWMQVPKGNGVYDLSVAASNSGLLSTDVGQFSIVPTGSAMSNNYQLSFTVTPTPTGDVTTATVIDTTLPASPVTIAAGLPFTSGQAISFSAPNAGGSTESMSITVFGKPANGDAVNVSPYNATTNTANGNLFELMDKAINGIKQSTSNNPLLAQTVSQALTRLDSGMDKLQAARSQAGTWLNRADALSSSNDALSTQLEGDRSNAQDLDMVKGISDMERMKTGYQTALQSYAQIQKLSLFDYIR